MGGRAHFFGAAARIIRRILVDHARGKDRLKRGGIERIPLDASAIHNTGQSIDLIALHERWNAETSTRAVQDR